MTNGISILYFLCRDWNAVSFCTQLRCNFYYNWMCSHVNFREVFVHT